jgi:hypothetical protein
MSVSDLKKIAEACVNDCDSTVTMDSDQRRACKQHIVLALQQATSPAAPSPEVKPFTPTKSTWQAGVEFKAWIARNTDATPDKIAEKALKIFSECGTAPPDAFPPRPAFVAPEKPDTLIRLKGGDGFSFWAHKRAGGYLAGNMIYRFEEYEAIDLKTGEVIA